MKPFEPFELYSYSKAPWWHNPFVLLAILVSSIVVGIGIIVLYRCIKKRRKVLTPWEIALVRLHQLAGKKESVAKDFYYELTALLKTYFTQRYAINLEGKTDMEIIESLDSVQLPGDLIDRLKKIFQGAYYIKFAQESTVAEYMHKDLNRAIDIVRNSIPVKHSAQK